jgi:hypothetical protein
MTPFHPSVCPSQRATWQPYTPTACRRRGWPSAYMLLCRGQRYADGLLRGLSRRRPTPTATTFGRRHRSQPSASSPIPVVSMNSQSRQPYGRLLVSFPFNSHSLLLTPSKQTGCAYTVRDGRSGRRRLRLAGIAARQTPAKMMPMAASSSRASIRLATIPGKI